MCRNHIGNNESSAFTSNAQYVRGSENVVMKKSLARHPVLQKLLVCCRSGGSEGMILVSDAGCPHASFVLCPAVQQ